MWRAAGGPTKADRRSSTSFASPAPCLGPIHGCGLGRGRASRLTYDIHTLPDHVVVLAIGTHVGRRRHAIGHVIETRYGRDVPDITIGEPGLAQALPVGLFDLVGLLG